MYNLNATDKALLDPSRFHIYFYLLKNGSKTISDLSREVEIFDSEKKKVKKLSKTAVSRHCLILEAAGLLIAEARFKGKQGIGKLYKATQRPRWEEIITMRDSDPKQLPDDVYEKMDELSFHPRYLAIVEKEMPKAKSISLMREKESFDQVLAEKKDKILEGVRKDPELKPIYEEGFKKFFEFLVKA